MHFMLLSMLEYQKNIWDNWILAYTHIARTREAGAISLQLKYSHYLHSANTQLKPAMHYLHSTIIWLKIFEISNNGNIMNTSNNASNDSHKILQIMQVITHIKHANSASNYTHYLHYLNTRKYSTHIIQNIWVFDSNPPCITRIDSPRLA